MRKPYPRQMFRLFARAQLNVAFAAHGPYVPMCRLRLGTPLPGIHSCCLPDLASARCWTQRGVNLTRSWRFMDTIAAEHRDVPKSGLATAMVPLAIFTVSFGLLVAIVALFAREDAARARMTEHESRRASRRRRAF
jgi:hypothetical protein